MFIEVRLLVLLECKSVSVSYQMRIFVVRRCTPPVLDCILKFEQICTFNNERVYYSQDKCVYYDLTIFLL